ncbi:DUF302 domain-containing protein [Mycobacterium sp. AT1]|uniref:DUF302 domain-containing protein n=1 Tax=Mycobacterium sp. AT1 TaxID=1961706 RepID=UPI001E30BA62|nr:DUF302 domain-containing protein [Mycobacterium sp. AT1]
MTSSNDVIEYQTRRLDIGLPSLYDQARDNFERLVPEVDYARFFQLANWQAHLELAEINAPHGFMFYNRIDVSAVLANAPSAPWKATQYLMGNHTIAERMFRHDPSIMLHAPLRALIYADREGHTHFTIDQPSSLFDSYDSPAVSAVGVELDELAAQLIHLLGGQPPSELTSRR